MHDKKKNPKQIKLPRSRRRAANILTHLAGAS